MVIRAKIIIVIIEIKIKAIKLITVNQSSKPNSVRNNAASRFRCTETIKKEHVTQLCAKI